jgi:BirA family biotin operon repressor/biotin-[acetyl-CoA-carboxylase] ligase
VRARRGATPALPSGYSLVTLDRVDSTNAEAKRLAGAGAEAGTVVRARVQEQGRGRRGRAWSSPPGNLYCSVLLRPTAAPGEVGQLSFVTALAVGEALESLLPAERQVRLKWPNDVLVNGAKVSGILIETAATGGGPVQFAIVGTGINVASFPENAERPATSLAAEGADAGVDAVLEVYLAALDGWLGRWRAQGFAPVRATWLERATGVGDAVEVRLPERTLTGTFEALDEHGALVLADATGQRRAITAGDVFLAGETAGLGVP